MANCQGNVNFALTSCHIVKYISVINVKMVHMINLMLPLKNVNVHNFLKSDRWHWSKVLD